jgi:hypothetical protein
METRRAWLVDGSQITALPMTSTGKPVMVGMDGRLTLVGQSGGSGDSDPALAAAIVGTLAFVLVLSLAVEAVPGALIAHYGYNLGWWPSFGVGVGTAIGFNMIAGLLQGSPAGAPQTA